jgi:hypothetical protein
MCKRAYAWICNTLMPREVYLIAAMAYLAMC